MSKLDTITQEEFNKKRKNVMSQFYGINDGHITNLIHIDTELLLLNALDVDINFIRANRSEICKLSENKKIPFAYIQDVYTYEELFNKFFK